MEEQFATPMMKQYQEIRSRYPDCLLFFRMGDFYELFLDHAEIGAKVLNITLTSKPIGKGKRIPMAGVPYHAADNYLTKLVKAGHKVAICEQLSPPNKYGIVERDVIRIVTPGTQLDEQALEKKDNNFIISLSLEKDLLSISISDLSTGFFAVKEKSFENLESSLKEELAKLKPVECILSLEDYANFELLKILSSEKQLNVYPFFEMEEYTNNPKTILKKHFAVSTLASFSIEDKPLCQTSAAALLGYLKQTQKSELTHIKKITYISDDDYMLLDRSTMINLELFSTIREHDTKGTLLQVLDETTTAMGGRLLKEWLTKPLKDKQKIEERYDAIEAFLSTDKQIFFEALKKIPDIERLLSRLSVGLGNARDVNNLKEAFIQILFLKVTIEKDTTSLLLKKIVNDIPEKLSQLISLIENQISEEPPIDLKIGGIFKDNINPKIDELRKIINHSKEWMRELEKTEREKTGIQTLKIRFNKVFGFYIEVSKAQAENVPKQYFRKQTLVNGERFITKELKEKEELILTAESKLIELEYSLFLELVKKIIAETNEIQSAALSIAKIDCLLNFSSLSERNKYIRPKLLYSGEIKIKNGRHPVVEKLLEENQFVPNNIHLDNIHNQLLIITGPNMAGKSVYIRQVALLSLMAQIGIFIPAESAHISIVDRIFVRSGASDVITSGLSTFMVEMVETAYILNNATENSLIIMDEIGRGTSTYDGISIAWAIAEYLVTHFKKAPKTLFATHYHELQQLESEFPNRIKNFSMAIAHNDNTPVFLYTIVEGAAAHSYGVAVAKLAGVPTEVIENAKQKLKILEAQFTQEYEEITNKELFQEQQTVLIGQKANQPLQVTYPRSDEQTIFEHILYKELELIDIAQMTPLDALNKLANLKEKIKIIQSSNIKLQEDN